MAATYEPLSVPRRNPTEDAALARVGREPMRRLEVMVLDWALFKYDERPSAHRAAVLAIMDKANRQFA